VEFERGWICLKAGDKKKADEILNRVVKEYPNHPVAARARGFLQ
jgi:TolA-binding protein